MKIIHIILAFVAFAFVSNYSIAKVYDRNMGRDLKLPAQKMLEYQRVSAPAAASTAYILTANDGDDSGAAATVSTFTAQPDVPRVLVVTPGGTTADVAAGNVVITGTNIHGEAITDTLAFLANASTATTGTKAFKTVSSIVFPAEDSPYGATWTVGITDKLGLKHCLAQAGDVIQTVFNGTREATQATCNADVDEVEKNYCDPNSAADGSNVDFYFVQNYRCLY